MSSGSSLGGPAGESMVLPIVGGSRCLCWIKRPAYLMKQFSLLEIISTVVLLAIVVVVVDLSRVFHAFDSATLQVTHRCTPAPYGILAALPTHSFGDMDHLVIQIFALYVRCRLVLQ